jgi:hypothetical protein
MKVHYLKPGEFKRLIHTLSDMVEFNDTERHGITVTVGNTTQIVICDDPSLTRTEREVILQHEVAHANGFDDEEDADMEAYRHLSKSGKELLRQNWPYRHGHPFPV